MELIRLLVCSSLKCHSTTRDRPPDRDTEMLTTCDIAAATGASAAESEQHSELIQQ